MYKTVITNEWQWVYSNTVLITYRHLSLVLKYILINVFIILYNYIVTYYITYSLYSLIYSTSNNPSTVNKFTCVSYIYRI